jgi:hypothetical protein
MHQSQRHRLRTNYGDSEVGDDSAEKPDVCRYFYVSSAERGPKLGKHDLDSDATPKRRQRKCPDGDQHRKAIVHQL